MPTLRELLGEPEPDPQSGPEDKDDPDSDPPPRRVYESREGNPYILVGTHPDTGNRIWAGWAPGRGPWIREEGVGFVNPGRGFAWNAVSLEEAVARLQPLHKT